MSSKNRQFANFCTVLDIFLSYISCKLIERFIYSTVNVIAKCST